MEHPVSFPYLPSELGYVTDFQESRPLATILLDEPESHCDRIEPFEPETNDTIDGPGLFNVEWVAARVHEAYLPDHYTAVLIERVNRPPSKNKMMDIMDLALEAGLSYRKTEKILQVTASTFGDSRKIIDQIFVNRIDHGMPLQSLHP